MPAVPAYKSIPINRRRKEPLQDLTGYVAVTTPSDTTTYDPPIRAIYVGTTGNVAITGPDGTVVTLIAPALGVWHRCAATKIMATNTTAGGIVGGFTGW